MRNDLLLIQSALADKNLSNDDLLKISDYGTNTINLYSLKLPEKFKGLPRKWHFGVLPEQEKFKKNTKNLIFKEANEVITLLLKDKGQYPIVFISDDSNINFGDELTYRDKAVFFLNKNQLPGKEHFPKVPQDAPVLQAARSKFKNSEATIYLSPYSPNIPVNDWKFFGRKKEINAILKSESNFFILGARRMGKTSLLQELKRQLQENGETVYWIECQYKDKIQDIINDILNRISSRDYYRALMKDKGIELNFLTTILRNLKGDKRNITLIFDELGNVINKIGDNAWKFVGALREVSHNYNIRIIVSAFQEIIIKQRDFEGPFVNFGETIHLSAFTKNEIVELLIEPLYFWGKIESKSGVENKVKKYFGGHPLVLQFVGKRVIEMILQYEEKTVDKIIDKIIDDEMNYFASAVDDLFLKIDSYLERYVFLSLCIEFDTTLRKEIALVDITQNTLQNILVKANIKLDLDKRVLLLNRLTLRGLLSQSFSNKNQYRIECPIIYHYLKSYYSPIELAQAYLNEINDNPIDHFQ